METEERRRYVEGIGVGWDGCMSSRPFSAGGHGGLPGTCAALTLTHVQGACSRATLAQPLPAPNLD